MVIIIEGPDGSGKTSLALKLAEDLGYEYIHFEAPTTEDEKNELFRLYHDTLCKYNGVVIDRMWYSTMVYGPIFRGGSEVSETQSLMLEGLIKDKGFIIYCTGDPDIMWQRATERGENYVLDRQTYMQICKAYDKLMLEEKHNVPVHPWILKGNI